MVVETDRIGSENIYFRFFYFYNKNILFLLLRKFNMSEIWMYEYFIVAP